MRFILASLVVLASVSAALAQEAPPRWIAQPDARDFARAYPNRAQQDNVSGAAVLCCTINEDRSLNCTAPFEWPAGYGFGEATLRISHEFRASEEYYAETRANPAQPIRRMIRWQVSGSPQLTAAFTRIAEETQNICGDPATPAS